MTITISPPVPAAVALLAALLAGALNADLIKMPTVKILALHRLWRTPSDR